MILSSTTPPTVFSAPPRPPAMDVPPTMTIGMTSIGPCSARLPEAENCRVIMTTPPMAANRPWKMYALQI